LTTNSIKSTATAENRPVFEVGIPINMEEFLDIQGPIVNLDVLGKPETLEKLKITPRKNKVGNKKLVVSNGETFKDLVNVGDVIMSIFGKFKINVDVGVDSENPSGIYTDSIEYPTGVKELYNLRVIQLEDQDHFAVSYTDLDYVYTSRIIIVREEQRIEYDSEVAIPINSSCESIEMSVSGDHTILYIFNNSEDATVQTVLINRTTQTSVTTNNAMDVRAFQVYSYFQYNGVDTFARGRKDGSTFIITQFIVNSNADSLTMVDSKPFNFFSLKESVKMKPEIIKCNKFEADADNQFSCFVEISKQIGYLVQYDTAAESLTTEGEDFITKVNSLRKIQTVRGYETSNIEISPDLTQICLVSSRSNAKISQSEKMSSCQNTVSIFRNTEFSKQSKNKNHQMFRNNTNSEPN